MYHGLTSENRPFGSFAECGSFGWSVQCVRTGRCRVFKPNAAQLRFCSCIHPKSFIQSFSLAQSFRSQHHTQKQTMHQH